MHLQQNVFLYFQWRFENNEEKEKEEDEKKAYVLHPMWRKK